MNSEEQGRLLGMIDAIQQAIIEIACEMPSQARHAIASELDVYGSRAEKISSSISRAEGLREAAWHMAKHIWPEKAAEGPFLEPD